MSKELNHGTISTYTTRRCRCSECRRAWTDYNLARRAERSKLEPPKHGYTGYTNYSCRCPICRQANTDRARTLNRARRKPSPTPAIRGESAL